MCENTSTLEKVREVLTSKFAETHSKEVSEESIKEFESIFNSNKAVAEIVTLLVNCALMSEVYRSTGLLLIKRFAHLYKTDHYSIR